MYVPHVFEANGWNGVAVGLGLGVGVTVLATVAVTAGVAVVVGVDVRMIAGLSITESALP
jgi:hypothetical protein